MLAVESPALTVTVANCGLISSLKVRATSGGAAVRVAPDSGLDRTREAWADAGRAPRIASTEAASLSLIHI